jgi:hypothetical protein
VPYQKKIEEPVTFISAFSKIVIIDSLSVQIQELEIGVGRFAIRLKIRSEIAAVKCRNWD